MDHYRRIKRLIIFRPCINISYNIHTAYHFSKSGVPLPIRVIVASEVEARLIADTDKEFGGSCTRRGTGQ